MKAYIERQWRKEASKEKKGLSDNIRLQEKSGDMGGSLSHGVRIYNRKGNDKNPSYSGYCPYPHYSLTHNVTGH